MEKTVDGLAKHIAKHISYDGTGDECCPHCGKVITPSVHWIDHRDRLASEIVKYLGFGSVVQDVVSELLDDERYVTGKPKEDGKELATLVWDAIYEAK